MLAAGAIETARLLLASGVGNENDQVGRYLQAHVYSGATGLFDEPVEDWAGSGAVRRHHRVPARQRGPGGRRHPGQRLRRHSVRGVGEAARTGFIAPEGEPSLADLAEVYPRSAVVIGPVQEVPQAESRVALAGGATDAWGVPLVELVLAPACTTRRPAGRRAAGRPGRALAGGQRRAARRADVLAARPPSPAPVSTGRARAGWGRTRRRRSPTPRGRVWNWSGISVADAALHVTNGGVDPALTILAGAWRVADLIAADR